MGELHHVWALFITLGCYVSQVAFVPNTHYVFSVGKDRMVKYWDMDRWELLLDLPGHHAEVCINRPDLLTQNSRMLHADLICVQM